MASNVRLLVAGSYQTDIVNVSMSGLPIAAPDLELHPAIQRIAGIVGAAADDVVAPAYAVGIDAGG